MSWERLEALFELALARPEGEREAFIDSQTTGDLALRSELHALVAHARTDDETLVGVVKQATTSVARDLDAGLVGTMLGHYWIERRIGSGGMGTVYLGQRRDGEYRARVAIKVLRASAVGSPLFERFLDERQLLATLDHPGIVKLLDGGTTSSSVPYLVMEFVEGESITAYARTRTIRERIRLIIELAAALQYAHQRLIVHRDLKPGNILVDTRGTPRLLDFGIAKVLDETGQESRHAVTRAGMAMFTPEYASPEQVRGDPVTIATDVYGLGAVLFELLTDVPPQSAGRNLAETIELICTRPPPLPSAVVSPSQGRELSGDLDSIVAKALQRRPSDRYSSVAQLGEDLERYLVGDPVLAREGTWQYRLRKFISRYRVELAIAASVMIALSVATVVSIAQARRADRHAEQAQRDNRELLRERATQELAQGRASRALPYLAEILRHGDTSAAVALLVAEAMRPYAHEIAEAPIPSGATAMTVSPNTSRIAVTSMDGSLSLFEPDGTLFASSRVSGGSLEASAISSTERVIAAVGHGTLQVWELVGRELRKRCALELADRVSAAAFAFTARDEQLLVALHSGAAMLIDPNDCSIRARRTSSGDSNSMTVAAIAHRGALVALGSSNGAITLWRTNGEREQTLRDSHASAVRALEFSGDDEHLISGGDDRSVRSWTVRSGDIDYVLPHPDGPVTAVALSVDDRMLATATGDGSGRIWDRRTGTLQTVLLGTTHSPIRSLRFSDRGDELVGAAEDATYRSWTVATGAGVLTVEGDLAAGAVGRSAPGGHDARVLADSRIATLDARGLRWWRADHDPLRGDLDVGFLAESAVYSPDGALVAVAGAGRVAIWSTKGERLHDVSMPEDEFVDVTWSPDGNLVLAVGLHGRAVLIRPDGTIQRMLVGHLAAISRSSWRPDSREVVTGSEDGTARIWSASDGLQRMLLQHPEAVMAAAWSPDGRRVATSCSDGKLRVWDAQRGTLLGTVNGNGMKFLDVSWSPDGERLAASGRDGDAGIWSWRTGTLLVPLQGHTNVVITAVWSPDGQLIATAADNGEVFVWDPATGAQLLARRQPGECLGLVWSMRGDELLVASSDGHVRRWDVTRSRLSSSDLDDFVAKRVPYRLDGVRLERVDDHR